MDKNLNKKKKTLIFTVIIAVITIMAVYRNYFSEEKYSIDESTQIIEETQETDKVSDINEVVVYISGAVKNPGVLTMTSEDRLADAIEMVGGTVDGADMNAVNLAEKLADGKHYIIPKIGENVAPSGNNQVSASNSKGSDGKININTATAEELDKLPGVGESTAQKIISYREESGGFKSVEELKNVNGIGDKKFEDMKDSVTI
ncbi:helix-hairpin-helix domain-containing protein [Peptacetobacter hominis]|uniref:helix-hairpin-helix domain-containing protein n=1 Tax=Peptacetobacter hominis TaxID=2743610 RepID=UPI001FE76802|nr:helix-hairpin-helix domain-containing protein [Peptacetobacter hominis]